MSDYRLIVGLGNPGKDYEYTRHNLGFLVLVELAKQLKLKFQQSSFTKGFIAEGEYEGQRFYLLMPMTFVNLSGMAVKSMLVYRKLEPGQMLVIADDLNLPFKEIRVRGEGSAGGHNGLKSIIADIGTMDFPRLRMGIGRPVGKEETVDYVLGTFSREEKVQLTEFIQDSAACCLVWLKEGLATAMLQYNNRRKDNEKK